MGVYRSHRASSGDDDPYPDQPPVEDPPFEPTSRSSGTVYGRPRTDPHDGYEPAHQPHDGYGYDEPEFDPEPERDYDVDWEAELDRGRRTPDEVDPAPPRPRRRDPTGAVRAGVRGFGELLITFGLVVLLFAGYEVWGKAAQVDAAQNALDNKIEDTWGGGEQPTKSKPLPGDAIARLYIPKLDKHWVVVQGVKPADIKNAPGHYPDTVMPGKVGNFSIAGHRAKAMFWDLDKLQPGDKIFVEDQKYFYEYVISETKIVLPNAVEVVAPVPGRPGETAKDPMLTLTTCNPKWDNYERLIVHAKTSGEPRPKSLGLPPELGD
ncbi:MAG: class E sortase [Micromonosporaceae bacterium]